MTTTATLDFGRPRPIQHQRGLANLKTFLGLRRDPLGTLTRIGETYGDTAAFHFGPFKSLVVTRDPDVIEHILVRGRKSYGKNTHGYRQMRLLLGNGLLTSQGELWMRQRRIAAPAFHRKRIAAFAETMARCAGELVDDWMPIAHRRGRLDISAEMMAVTLKIAGLTLLSVDISDQTSAVKRALTAALETISVRTRSLRPPPLWLPTPGNVRFTRARAELDRIVRGIIRDRRQSGEDTGDLLSMFMLARDEQSGEQMNDEQLRDEVMTMFLAGHETTAMALTWSLVLLARHPDWADRVRREVDEVLGDRTPGFADLPRLEVTERAIQEAMRLYPPAPVLARSADEDDVAGDFVIPQGAYCVMSPYVVHRHPRYWADPDRYDPDRFLPERFGALPRFAYLPFSGGQRKCIGDHFAMMEAQIVLATLMQRVRLSLRPGQRVEPEPSVTLRVKGGVSMGLAVRHR